MHYSENEKGQAKEKSVVCCDIQCAQDLMSDLEEHVYYFKLNVKTNNFIFVLNDIKIYWT